MLSIDGSYGEGGGQILRTAVALSVLTKKPVEINNIRANRPNPGMKAQHYIAINSVEELCRGKSEGLEIGSSHLIFKPGDIKGGKYKFDIGTAGSITLVFQTCILASLKSKEPLTIQIKGGTENKWAPTWDYFNYVFLNLLKKMGLAIDAQLIKRGYYPKGGGEAILTINPSKDIFPLHLSENQKFSTVNGVINSANLPNEVSTRMKHATIKTLLKKNLTADIKIEEKPSPSTGVGITLWTQSEDNILGCTVLGEKEIPAEKIGESAALQILEDIDAGATIDTHAFDQILPYFAVAKEKGSSCLVRKISEHAKTNTWLIKQFFDVDFEIEQNEETVKITLI